MNELKSVFNEILNSNEFNSSEKLTKLNNNNYLNGFLVTNNYRPLIKYLVRAIETDSETKVNIDVMKFYLHELHLIFNLNISHEYFKGVVFNGS